jgi:pyruvate/2-oxoglutarate dehydrogenase complex dihydrolipoamide dehydrogenase (E3) component
MVEDLIKVHLNRYAANGAELIMGEVRFVSPRTVTISLAGYDTRVIAGERVFLNLGTQATLPAVPGLAEAGPMTHVEVLDLDMLAGAPHRVGRRLCRP